MTQIEYEGDLQVFKELVARRDKKEGHEEMRPGLVILSGMMNGTFGGGGVRALERNGFTRSFTASLGASVGSPTLLYFLSGQAALGTSIFFDECTSGNFLSILNVFTKKFIANTHYLYQVFVGEVGNKKYDLETFARNPTRMYVTVCNLTKHMCLLQDVRRGDVGTFVEASTANLGISPTVDINGDTYADGCGCAPFPIDEFIALEEPTSVLVFANQSKRWMPSYILDFAEWIVRLFLIGRQGDWPTPELRSFNKKKGFEKLKKSGIPYCIVYCDDRIGGLTMNREKLIDAADAFDQYIASLIARAEAE